MDCALWRIHVSCSKVICHIGQWYRGITSEILLVEKSGFEAGLP